MREGTKYVLAAKKVINLFFVVKKNKCVKTIAISITQTHIDSDTSDAVRFNLNELIEYVC